MHAGILAVTRSIGDMPMKDFIVSNPYTTATVLTDQDAFLILACDGVIFLFQSYQRCL